MNREEAANLLNVPVNAQLTEIRSKYQELYNEYQIRLTNAPTPNLKKIYQSNLQELNQALEILQGTSNANQLELPSSSPTYKQAEQISSTNSGFNGSGASNNASKVGDLHEKSTKSKNTESNKLLIPVIAVAVVFAAVAVFFGLSDFDKKEQLDEYKGRVDSAVSLSKELDRYKANCSNQILKIKNDGSDFYITGVSVTYWNEFNKLEKQEYPYYDKLLVRGGGSTQLQRTEGSRVQWDGSVVSYAIGIEHNSADFFVSGIFSKDMKPEDKTLHLNFDNF